MQFVSVTSQVSFLSTSFHKKVKKYKEKPHLSKGKESTYLFGQSLIILLNENFVEEKDYKSMLWKTSLVFLLVLCSAYIHVISVLVVIEQMKRVWQPRLEIRAKTVKTFRSEKRSAQASAHPLSQAHGGLFCVLTGLVDFVCLWNARGANICSL